MFSKLPNVANTNCPISQVLLSAPRRTAAIPNPDGTLALFTVSTYSFESHSKTSEIRVLDIKTGQTKTLSKDVNASEPTWLGKGNLLLWLKGGEKGTTSLVVADVDNLENTYESQGMFRVLWGLTPDQT
jgi:hypothetical protein